MGNKAEEYLSRKQITFDLNQKALSQNYPRPKMVISLRFYKKAYKDISRFMKDNGFEHRQYSVYVSKGRLTTYDIVGLMEKLAMEMPWLYPCVNEIDVTDIGAQHSVKEILGGFTKQQYISIIRVHKEKQQGKMHHSMEQTRKGKIVTKSMEESETLEHG